MYSVKLMSRAEIAHHMNKMGRPVTWRTAHAHRDWTPRTVEKKLSRYGIWLPKGVQAVGKQPPGPRVKSDPYGTKRERSRFLAKSYGAGERVLRGIA